MKRSMLLVCALFAFLAGPAFADAPAETAEVVDAIAVEMAEPAAVSVETDLVQPQGDFEAEMSTNLGTVDCLCVCAAFIWSLDDVRTTGSCQDLVGQTCYNNWGQGTYTSCDQDGGGFPF